VRILIADDSAVTRRMLKDAVTEWQYEVVEAANGNEAWDTLQAEDAPRLAILDWLMPGIDGPEICRRIRAADQERYTYLVLNTTQSQREKIIEGLQSGADDYLVKPCDTGELEQRLRAGVRVIELQDRVLDANTKLARSNADLQQFASAAAHDLHAPLRRIRTISNLLQKQLRGQLDAEADEFFGFIITSAAQMQALIDGLLSFSRVAAYDLSFDRFDLNRVVNEVQSYLTDSIDECGGQVTSDPLPTIQADRVQIVQLLQNLIGNAIKYRGDRTPHVHIRAAVEANEVTISVADNGIGIDPKHAETVFQIFKRLHGDETYQGTGIGLATCKRIVDRHRGKIWVESEADKGSVFRFSIPQVTELPDDQ